VRLWISITLHASTGEPCKQTSRQLLHWQERFYEWEVSELDQYSIGSMFDPKKEPFRIIVPANCPARVTAFVRMKRSTCPSCDKSTRVWISKLEVACSNAIYEEQFSARCLWRTEMGRSRLLLLGCFHCFTELRNSFDPWWFQGVRCHIKPDWWLVQRILRRTTASIIDSRSTTEVNLQEVIS
jgi:hypothetical protein